MADGRFRLVYEEYNYEEELYEGQTLEEITEFLDGKGGNGGLL